ncbi:DNA breaking-rejoining enzyme [Pholiota molesta]|nr:DNA breaking-rejoining enzyme [Pholiota molesta]
MSSDPLSIALAGVDVAAEAARLSSRVASNSQAGAPQALVRRIKKPRRPKEGNSYSPSFFRPHVLASERLIAWTTPITTPFRRSLSSILPAADALALLHVMLFSLDEKTRELYGAGPLCFTQYCDSRGIPEDAHMPASEVLLAGFATAMAAGKVARTTLDNWLAGLHFWHTINGCPWHGEDMLRAVKGGVSKLVPDTSRRAKRPPVSIQHMYALRRSLDLSSSFDAAVWVLACVAFWSCCRLGELLIPSRYAFQPLKHVARGCPISFREDAGRIHSVMFHVPWTKTTFNLSADIVVTKLEDPSDPYEAFKHHLTTNSSVPDDAPLFSFATADGSYAPMTRSWFLGRCEDVWVASGMPRMAGHGFRIGGATELLLHGTPPDVVAVQGRWKSRSFLEYWRRIEGILPLFVTNSFASSRAALVADTMAIYSRSHGR